MTRETKVGIVISCVFACLAGTVTMQKLRGGGDAPTAVPSPTAGAETKPTPAKPLEVGYDKAVSATAGLAPKSEAKVTPVSGSAHMIAFEPGQVRVTQEVTPVDPLPAKPVDPLPAKPVDPLPAKPVDPLPVDPAPVKPVDPMPAKPLDPLPSQPVDPLPAKPVDPLPTKPLDPIPATPIDPVLTKPLDPLPAKPLDPLPAKPVDPMPVDPAPVKPVDPSPAKPLEPLPSQPVDPMPVKPVDPMPTKPLDPIPATPIDPVPTKPLDPLPAKPIDPLPARSVDGQVDPRISPRPTEPSGPVPSTQVTGATISSDTGRLAPVADKTTIAVGEAATTPIPREGPRTTTQPTEHLPAGDSAAPVTPSVMASIKSTPLLADGEGVVSYSETEYVCQDKDTLKSVSAHYYQSEGYAEALKLWNLNHRKQPTAVRGDGSLVPQGTIYLPSTAELHRRYPDTLPRVKPVAAQGVEASGTVPAVYKTPATPQYYKVEKEEAIGVIAQRTLGALDRWQEIQQLNPNVDPEKKLAAGTVLVMPAGAVVPPENVYTLKKP